MAGQDRRVRLTALAVALGTATAAASASQDALPREAPSRAVANTHNCADYYPDLSRKLNETGDVLIGYDVAADGTLSNIKIVHSSGSARLDEAALQCVTQRWRNTPARRGGIAVASPGHQAVLRFMLHTPSLPGALTPQDVPNLPNALGSLGGPNVTPDVPATTAVNTTPDAWEVLALAIGGLAVFGWFVVGLRRWVFLARDCPNCDAANRSLLPFTQPGYCSSCGTKFS